MIRLKLGIPLLLALAGILSPLACSPTGAQPANGAAAQDASPAPAVAGEEETAALVVATRLRRSPIQTFIEVSSDLEALSSVQIYPQLSGICLVERCVDEGDFVHQGDLLARLDAAEIELELAQAEVSYEEAKHRCEKADFATQEAAEREKSARTQAEKAKRDYEKALSMLQGELISEDEFATDRLTWEQASSDLEVAAFQQKQVSLDAKLAETELKKCKIATDNASVRLARTRITAPFDGYITYRNATRGMTVSASTLLFTLVDRDHLIAHLHIPQEELRKVAVGMEVTFTCDALPDGDFHGTLTVVNPAVDSGSGTVKLRADIDPDPQGLLRPGMFITARVITESKPAALMVPRKAVFYEDEKPTFFLISEEEKALKVHFSPGGSTEYSLEIAGVERDNLSMEEGARIVIVGQDNLKDGDRVKVLKETS